MPLLLAAISEKHEDFYKSLIPLAQGIMSHINVTTDTGLMVFHEVMRNGFDDVFLVKFPMETTRKVRKAEFSTLLLKVLKYCQQLNVDRNSISAADLEKIVDDVRTTNGNYL
jgi:hypothetical protein